MGSGHVFLSYSTSDRPLAEDLWRRLESRGVPVWIAPHHIPPGSDYSEAIETAIESSGAVVALISEGANASRHVRAEIEIAFSRGKPLFPVRFQDIQPAKGLSLFLSLGHWTDLFGTGETTGLDRLAAELVGRSGGPAAAPAPVRPSPAPAPPRPAPAVGARFLVATIALSLVVIASVVAFAILRRGAPAATHAADAGSRPSGAASPAPQSLLAPAPRAPPVPNPQPDPSPSPAPAPPPPGGDLPPAAGGGIWEHNGSLLRLRAEGQRRVFVYLRPRPGVPARSGDILFDGERSGSAYRGTAYLFSSQCGRIGYAVAGSVAPDDRSVALRGDAPVRDRRSCALVGHAGDQLVFRFVSAE